MVAALTHTQSQAETRVIVHEGSGSGLCDPSGAQQQPVIDTQLQALWWWLWAMCIPMCLVMETFSAAVGRATSQGVRGSDLCLVAGSLGAVAVSCVSPQGIRDSGQCSVSDALGVVSVSLASSGVGAEVVVSVQSQIP